MTSTAPFGWLAGAKAPCSSPAGPGKRMTELRLAAGPGVVAVPVDDAAADGADDVEDESFPPQASSKATAADTVTPSSVSRRSASRRVSMPSEKSSVTSWTRYWRRATGTSMSARAADVALMWKQFSTQALVAPGT